MADFKHASSTPEGRMAEARPAHDQGGNPVQCCDNCEPQKFGSESIANFSEGPGVAPNRSKIH